MRLLLAGIAVETTEYTENENIHFAVYTHECDSERALGEALDPPDCVVSLIRGGEELAVKVVEHRVWPPSSRRFGDIVQRHDVCLESIDSSNRGGCLRIDQ